MDDMYPIIDLHQDLLFHVAHRERLGQGRQTDWELLRAANVKICITTAFPAPADGNHLSLATNGMITDDLHGYTAFCTAHDDWRVIRSAADFFNVMCCADRRGILLHIEGFNAATSIDTLESWYDLGMRSAGIVWNLTNPCGGGTTDPEAGLTTWGHEVLVWLAHRRVLIDYAHMNDATFRAAADKRLGPVYISHGAVRAVLDSPRNYDDTQLRLVAESGGLFGIFFANTYIAGKGVRGSVADVVSHLTHIRRVIGSSHLALGTDFGGILSGTLRDLDSIVTLPTLFDALRTTGWSEDEIAGLAYKNAHTFLQRVLP